uniref:Specifically androgen-regulated gene protein-like n=1 Tax=Sinocyclocheilus grahami TaxID=75366 RepID=A0A672KBP2_SINGR
MFLEETIESLEVEDDSGLSNDEPDRPTNGMKDKTAQRTSIYQNKSDAHEDPNKAIGRDCKPSQKYLVPTPLLLASGNAKIVSKPMESSPKEAPPPEWIPQLPKMEPHVSGGSVKPTEATKSVSADPDTSSEPLSHNEVENLRKKVSMKKAPHLTPLMVAHHSAADKPMTPSPSSEHVPKEYSDPKSPPAVAPKPKKLPSNIIIKSHKDPGTTHSLLSQTERAQMDPQKIRMEALKKLGLLKNEEVETGHGVSPSHSPTFRAKKPQSLCNPTEPFQELSRLSESPVPGDVQLLADTLKHQDAKSREDRTQVELSPGQLRKSRDRPSSVGSTKDFGIGHHANDSTKSLNALPRSGISVMISPHGNNGENRREALKKLGLLRD